MTRGWLLAHALLLSACTTQHDIGTTCDDGVCETLMADLRIPCLISTGTPSSVDEQAPQGCMSERIWKGADDLAPCRLFLSLAPGSPTCQALGFATAEDVGLPSSTVCEVAQLEAAQRAQEPSATGWYIEGPPLSESDPCGSTTAQQRFHFTAPIEAARGTTWLSCGAAIAAPEDLSAAQRTGDQALLVDPASCSGLPPLPKRIPDDIGALCEARVAPPSGFFTDRTYIDVRSEQCTSGVCLVDATQSPLPWPCEPGAMSCDEPPPLADYTYCSCRCDAKGDGTRAPCDCPMGFTCANQLLASEVVPDTVAGSYCVREFFF